MYTYLEKVVSRERKRVREREWVLCSSWAYR